MAFTEILAELDAEITRLERVRKLLSNGRNVQFNGSATNKSTRRKKRALSAEARKWNAEFG